MVVWQCWQVEAKYDSFTIPMCFFLWVPKAMHHLEPATVSLCKHWWCCLLLMMAYDELQWECCCILKRQSSVTATCFSPHHDRASKQVDKKFQYDKDLQPSHHHAVKYPLHWLENSAWLSKTATKSVSMRTLTEAQGSHKSEWWEIVQYPNL